MSTSVNRPPVHSCPGVNERAALTLGISCEPIYRAVTAALASRREPGGLLLDVGCGVGNLWQYVAKQFDRYLGADVLRHEGFPSGLEFCAVNLDTNRVPLPDGAADVVAAVETIEHLENPRAFMRELTRLTQSGGWVIVTTPNQISFLSKLTLLVKNQFNAFQANCYPAHLTALLEVDLKRIAAECGLTDVSIIYTGRGRMPGLALHWPSLLSRFCPRALSDNVILVGRKAPTADSQATSRE